MADILEATVVADTAEIEADCGAAVELSASVECEQSIDGSIFIESISLDSFLNAETDILSADIQDSQQILTAEITKFIDTIPSNYGLITWDGFKLTVS